MTAVTVAVTASDDGTLTIPKHVAEALGLYPGQEAELVVEARNGRMDAESPDYDSILDSLFAETDNLVLEPGKPLTDPYEAQWGAAVEDKFRKMGLKL